MYGTYGSLVLVVADGESFAYKQLKVLALTVKNLHYLLQNNRMHFGVLKISHCIRKVYITLIEIGSSAISEAGNETLQWILASILKQ